MAQRIIRRCCIGRIEDKMAHCRTAERARGEAVDKHEPYRRDRRAADNLQQGALQGRCDFMACSGASRILLAMSNRGVDSTLL